MTALSGCHNKVELHSVSTPHAMQDVLNVIEKERPEGIIVQFGGQTPLSIAKPLQEALLKNPVQAASGAPELLHDSSCHELTCGQRSGI